MPNRLPGPHVVDLADAAARRASGGAPPGAVPDAGRLGAYRLGEPALRFGYDDRTATHQDPYQGLRTHGPHDAADRRRLGQRVVRAVVVGRRDRPAELANATKALAAKRLGKFHEACEVAIVDTVLVPPADPRHEAEAYRRAIREWLADGPYKRETDVAFVLHDDEEAYRAAARGVTPYYSSKAVLMLAGIPTQSLAYKYLGNAAIQKFEQYHLANILIAVYAKIGGTPWVIQAGSVDRPDVTVGVATTAVDEGGEAERFVGISTIFRENGSFALWNLTAPERTWEAYGESLERSIVDGITTFEAREGRQVRRIACHVAGKRAGYRETDAIARALAAFEGRTIAADLVHISDSSTLWLYDGLHASHLPESGILTALTLDGRRALLHTDGRRGGGGPRFLSQPLALTIHGPEVREGWLDVYQHLYDLRWMSWRSVRASSRPVSVAYPKAMARLLAYLHQQEDVEALQLLPQLKNKAWFL